MHVFQKIEVLMLLKRLFFLLKAIYIIELSLIYILYLHNLSHSHALFCTPNFLLLVAAWLAFLLVYR